MRHPVLLNREQFLNRSIVIMAGQHAGQNEDDTQIIPMAVHAEMTAGLDAGAAETKLSALHAYDLFAEDNRREGDRIIQPFCVT